MIFIRATGSTDVKSLRKLARSLSAEISVEDLAPPVPATRKSSRPSVSTLPGATISAQTREAMMKLQPVEIEAVGEYELP